MSPIEQPFSIQKGTFGRLKRLFMDVSSKYFALLRVPGPQTFKHLWHFWLDIRRVGKARELASFVWWEISHRLCLYQARNRYVNFTHHAGLALTNDGSSQTGEVIASSFLAENGWCFRAVAIDWKFCLQTTNGWWVGSRFSHLNALYRSNDQSQSAVLIHEFDHPITSLFGSRKDTLFVCSNGVIYKSEDQGHSFRIVLQLSSPISYFLFNNGMTELPDGTFLIGEYGSIWQGQTWQNLAYLYFSADGGETWEVSDFLIRQGVNKHIHVVKYSSTLKVVLLTDGDNKKQLWMNTTLTDFQATTDAQKTGWRLLTQYHHQTGGYTAMAETEEGVLFGSDYLGGTNFIVRTTDGKRFQKRVLPDPYRRSPVMNMVTRESSTGTEIWAVSYSCLTEKARSLLICSKDFGNSWIRVVTFDGTKNEVRLVNTSPNRSEALYISVTAFGDDPNKTQHTVYRLERTV